MARAGGFTRAAEQEDLAQPTLSHQIHKLELELGVPLLERLGRGVRLTRFGEALLPRAREILRGRLSVGAIPIIMPYYLAPKSSTSPGVTRKLNCTWGRV